MFFKALIGYLIGFTAICFSLQKDNIFTDNLYASHNISFSTTRNLNDGALKTSLLEKFHDIFKANVFIETGTYLGDTTLAAAPIFEEVHSIELSLQLCLQAKQRLKAWKNVTIHLGDSAECLTTILSSIPGRLFFYLDGHYSGGITAQGPFNTPVLQELDAIKASGKSDSIILIDDIRLFQDSCYPNKFQKFSLDNYPEINQVVASLLQINPHYQICFLGDALLAFPKDSSIALSNVVSACALHRLASICSDCSEEDLVNADVTIGNAAGDERDELELYYRTYSPFELEYGYRSFGTLWYGLILKENGKEAMAQALFLNAKQNSMPNWRVTQLVCP